MEYQRTCKCGNTQNYSSKKSYTNSVKANSTCKRCSGKRIAKTVDRTFQQTDEYRQKMSKSLLLARKKSSRYDSEECRKKLRIAKLSQIEKLGTRHTFNVEACKFIDDLNKKKSWNLQHALNGGEIQISGYLLDGYDLKRNIVFEYDEPKHNAPSVKQRDVVRQERIIQKIHPYMFIRYNKQFKTLKDAISGKEIS